MSLRLSELAGSLSACPLGLGFSALVTVTAMHSRTRDRSPAPTPAEEAGTGQCCPPLLCWTPAQEESSPTLTAETIDLLLLKGP